jgi:hypothetical protein
MDSKSDSFCQRRHNARSPPAFAGATYGTGAGFLRPRSDSSSTRGTTAVIVSNFEIINQLRSNGSDRVRQGVHRPALRIWPRWRTPACRREVFGDLSCVSFSVTTPVSSGLEASSASCVRRNARSLAVFVRSASARCSYSGIGLRSPDCCSCLKRSSAFSLEVMKISLALELRNAGRLVGSLRTPTVRNKNCSEEAALVLFESVGWKPPKPYSGFGLRRQS